MIPSPGTIVKLRSYYRYKTVFLRSMSYADYEWTADGPQRRGMHSNVQIRERECVLVIATSYDSREGLDVFVVSREGTGWVRQDMLTTVNTDARL